MKYDITSLKIIEKLLVDGRATHQSIADEYNFSRPAIHQRVNKLEEDEVISGYSANIDFDKLGLAIDAFVIINAHTLDYNKFIKEVMELSDTGIFIHEVFRITGGKCVMIRVKTSSTEKLRQLHDGLLKIDGMIDTNTMLVLQTEINNFKGLYIAGKSEE